VTDALTQLWPLLEMPTPTVTPSAWCRIPAAERDVMAGMGLARPGALAQRVVCPVCAIPHTEPLIERPPRHKEGSHRYYIKCPREMRVELEEHHCRSWTIDVKRVAESVADSLHLDGRVQALLSDRLWQLGHMTYRDIRCEVYLARGAASSDFGDVLSRIPQAIVPPVVFVPAVLPPASDSDEPGPRWFALKCCHRLAEGALSFDRSAVTTAIHKQLAGDLAPAYLFRDAGDFWDVAFEGGPMQHVKHSKGMRYIWRLLQDPGVTLYAVDLLAAEVGIDLRSLVGTSGEEADDQWTREMRASYRELIDKRSELEISNKTERDKITAQVDLLDAELTRRLAKDGKPRETSDAERIRKSVSAAVSRGFDHIEHRLPELARHLRLHCRTGNSLCYDPGVVPDWILD